MEKELTGQKSMGNNNEADFGPTWAVMPMSKNRFVSLQLNGC